MKRLLILILFVSQAIYGQSELNLNAAAGLSKFNDGEKSIPQFSWYLSVNHRVNLRKHFFVGSSLLIRHIGIKKNFSQSLDCNGKMRYDYFVKSISTYAGFLFTIGWDIGPVWFNVSSNVTYPVQSKGIIVGLKNCVNNQITDIENKWINRFYKKSDFGIQLGLGYRFTNRMSAFLQFYHGFASQTYSNYYISSWDSYRTYVYMDGNNVQMVLGVKYSLIKNNQRYYKRR